ncbi:hypothetical protein PsYK624_082010 [Phanerochaete sordida]|uniref:Protein kinase domain-containing protein n=1 Tax=Phanerochaete sordida TaxID=48140 RepID=A0A9P3GBX5_9APHY|nr:hypothetical protein PsYK624_082010 [Phanerochaete sordida]
MSEESQFIGFVSPELFLERFMEPASGPIAVAPADVSQLEAARTVREASEALIRTVEKNKICPGLRLFVTKAKKRNLESPAPRGDSRHACRKAEATNSLQGTKAALCPPLVARRQPRATRRRSTKPKRDFAEYHDFATAELGFEVLLSVDEDPFCDSAPLEHSSDMHPSDAPHTHLVNGAASPHVDEALPQLRSQPAPANHSTIARSTQKAAATRSRLLAHAQATFARQHRCFLFQLVIVQDQVRFVRWDRAGAVVSSRFSAIHHPYLFEFLCQFDQMSDAQRGWDTTVTRATRREAMLFEDALRTFLAAETGTRSIPHGDQTLDSSGTYPTWKVRVVHEDTGEAADLLARRPFAGHQAMFGRATRAYLTFNLNDHRLVFMKDSWRVIDSRLQPEFQIYQELSAHAVPFIPYPMYGGDVHHLDGVLQETFIHLIANEWNEQDPFCPRMDGYIHHRLVQDIAYPLDSARDERELVQVIHDALIVLDRAHSELGLIHRDLSSLNVMLTRDGECLLSDWDHAGKLTQKAHGVGTFQFMSVRLLESKSDAVNEHVDDLESLFWVLLFVAIIRFAVRLDGIDLDMFRDPGSSQRHYIGATKCDHLYSAKYRERFRSAAFVKLLEDLASSWAEYYVAIYVRDEKDLPAELAAFGPDRMKILDQAKQPSFWIEKVASGLRAFDAEQAEASAKAQEHPSITDLDTHPQNLQQNTEEPSAVPVFAVVRSNRKRKAPGDDSSDDTGHPSAQSADRPRRSKRLKTMRGSSSR